MNSLTYFLQIGHVQLGLQTASPGIYVFKPGTCSQRAPGFLKSLYYVCVCVHPQGHK